MGLIVEIEVRMLKRVLPKALLSFFSEKKKKKINLCQGNSDISRVMQEHLPAFPFAIHRRTFTRHQAKTQGHFRTFPSKISITNHKHKQLNLHMVWRSWQKPFFFIIKIYQWKILKNPRGWGQLERTHHSIVLDSFEERIQWKVSLQSTGKEKKKSILFMFG